MSTKIAIFSCLRNSLEKSSRSSTTSLMTWSFCTETKVSVMRLWFQMAFVSNSPWVRSLRWFFRSLSLSRRCYWSLSFLRFWRDRSKRKSIRYKTSDKYTTSSSNCYIISDAWISSTPTKISSTLSSKKSRSTYSKCCNYWTSSTWKSRLVMI